MKVHIVFVEEIINGKFETMEFETFEQAEDAKAFYHKLVDEDKVKVDSMDGWVIDEDEESDTFQMYESYQKDAYRDNRTTIVYKVEDFQ